MSNTTIRYKQLIEIRQTLGNRVKKIKTAI